MGLIDYIKRKGVEFFVPEFFYPGAAEEILSGIQRTGDFTIQKEDGVPSGPRKPRLNLTTAKGLRNAYDECSVVSTILSRLAAALVNGKLVIRDKHTKQENQYGYSKIINLLNKPNNYQTYSEFMADLDITRYLFGVAVVYAPKTIGMSTPEALHVIDPDKVREDEGFALVRCLKERIILRNMPASSSMESAILLPAICSYAFGVAATAIRHAPR